MTLSVEQSKRVRFSGTMAGFLVLPCLGIASLRCFARVTSTFVPESAEWFAFQSLAIIVLLLLDRFVSYRQQDVVRLSIGAALAMALGGILTATDTGLALTTFGHILRSFCSGALIMCAGYYLCSIRLHHAVISIAAGFFLYSLAIQGTSLLPPGSYPPLAFALALATGLCLAWGINAAETPKASEPVAAREALRALPWTTWALVPVAVLYLFREVVPASAQGQAYGSVLQLVLCGAFLVAVLCWVVILRREDPDALLPLFILALFFGPLFYTVFSSFPPTSPKASCRLSRAATCSSSGCI